MMYKRQSSWNFFRKNIFPIVGPIMFIVIVGVVPYPYRLIFAAIVFILIGIIMLSKGVNRLSASKITDHSMSWIRQDQIVLGLFFLCLGGENVFFYLQINFPMPTDYSISLNVIVALGAITINLFFIVFSIIFGIYGLILKMYNEGKKLRL